jgi:hypothetical protein
MHLALQGVQAGVGQFSLLVVVCKAGDVEQEVDQPVDDLFVKFVGSDQRLQ